MALVSDVPFFRMRPHVVPYDSRWPGMFEEESVALQEIFPDCADIQHFGSTSIPDIPWAKPIIDIKIALPGQMPPTPEQREKLAMLGYYERPTGESAADYMRWDKGDPDVTHCLHLQTDETFANDTAILMRDYLRAHAAAREEYAEVKRVYCEGGERGGAHVGGGDSIDMLGYRTNKREVLSKIKELALQWQSDGRPCS